MMQLLETTKLDKEQKMYLRSSMGIQQRFSVRVTLDWCRKRQHSINPYKRHIGFQ